jgi:rubrerythrin
MKLIDVDECPSCHEKVKDTNLYVKGKEITVNAYPSTKTIENLNGDTLGILYWNCEKCGYYWKDGQFNKKG